MFSGYWDAPDETEAVFRDGWYVTGDRATRDEEGYLWFVGRADDVILSAAYRIGPVRGRERPARAPCRGRERRHRRPPRGTRADRQGVRRAPARTGGRRCARRRAAGACQGDHGAVQVPAVDRVRRRAPEDGERKDPPLRAPCPPACRGAGRVVGRPAPGSTAGRGRRNARPRRSRGDRSRGYAGRRGRARSRRGRGTPDRRGGGGHPPQGGGGSAARVRARGAPRGEGAGRGGSSRGAAGRGGATSGGGRGNGTARGRSSSSSGAPSRGGATPGGGR